MQGWLSKAAATAAFVLAMPAIAAVVSHDISAAVASTERPDADKMRDADRKPAELMTFAGVRPGLKVLELAPGGGYYTRLLSLVVGEHGYIYTNASRRPAAVVAWAQSHANVSVQVTLAGQVMVPEPVDIVWTTQNYHDFKNVKLGDSDAAAATNTAAFAALKPGGVYLINDHQGNLGTGTSQTSTLHRIEDVAVIREVEAAGFRLEARSDILRQPADDHTAKVFDSSVRGKTDQFVLRFRKPRGKR